MNKLKHKLIRVTLFYLTFAASLLSLTLPVKAINNSRTQIVKQEAIDKTSAQQTLSENEVQTALESVPVQFEENQGQYDKRVRFASCGAGYSLFLTATEAVYVLPMRDESEKAFALRMQIVGANPDSEFTGEAQHAYRTNYFRGNDESKWVTEVSNYGRVRYENIYQGVDMVWHGKEKGATQYDFVVEPNADTEQIRLEFNGADKIEIDYEGNLLIHTEAGTIKQNKPFSYQDAEGFRQEVESRFVIKENQQSVGFELGEYDRSKPLTIDPTVNLNNLSFSTFLGGEAIDISRGIAVDGAGNIYVTGSTTSLLFPTVTGGFDTSHTTEAIFVTKMNAIGTDLIYSTYLDGNGNDLTFGIAVDSSGNAYVTGFTTAADFPTTAGTAFDTSHNGGQDAFVTKLNTTGSALSYSTLIGGSGIDQGLGIAIDSSGNAYITGTTVDAVTDYPITGGAVDATHNGGNDAYISKINPSLSGASSLVYSSFIGGTANETARGIAVDPSNNFAYITGDTLSTNYPTAGSAIFDTTSNGGNDVFISVFNPVVSGAASLSYSTYIGGDSNDIARGIALDSAANIYVTGQTANGTTVDYPTTSSAFDTIHNGGDDVFVSKLNITLPAVNQLIYSTYIGGVGNDQANAIALDSFGNAYVTGETQDAATDYPITSGAFDTTHNGNGDVFVTKLNSTATTLLNSTFIGSAGSVDDVGMSIAVDTNGNTYITGQVDLPLTTSMPTTANAFQSNHNGGPSDGFVCKFGDFAIAGRAIDGTGAPVSSAMVTLSGPISAAVQTDSQGYFGFTDSALNQNFTVTAARNGFVFNPALFNISGLDGNRFINFIATTGTPTGYPGGILRVYPVHDINENSGFITIAIERVEVFNQNIVTIDYKTNNGTALSESDYTYRQGTLTFLPLELVKTINIPITDDIERESAEDFTLVLSNPTGSAGLSENSVTRITINDNDVKKKRGER